MGRTVSARKLSVASGIDAAETVLKERSAECGSVEPAHKEGAKREVSLESVLAGSKYAPPEGYQDEIRAHLEAELEAGATLYDFPEDGSCVALTSSGEQVVRQPSPYPSCLSDS